MKKIYLSILILFGVLSEVSSQIDLVKKGIDAFYGRTVPVNYQNAVSYFKEAVNQNDAEGAYWLAHCYYCGQGVELNTAKGDELLQKSVDAGCVKAMTKMAKRYYVGIYDEYLGEAKPRIWIRNKQKGFFLCKKSSIKRSFLRSIFARYR